MRKKLACILTIALLMTLVCADAASAKRSPSRRASSETSVKAKSHRGRTGRDVSRNRRRGRGKYAVRRRRGRHLARSYRRSSGFQPQDAGSSTRPAPGIPTERVTEIQNALIKAGYLDGPASGQYDDATTEAMKEFQAANGLPQTGLPSAIALKRLGVPKRSNDGYAVPVNSVSETDKKRAPM